MLVNMPLQGRRLLPHRLAASSTGLVDFCPEVQDASMKSSKSPSKDTATSKSSRETL